MVKISVVLLCLENKVNKTGGFPGGRTHQYPLHQMINSEVLTGQRVKSERKKSYSNRNSEENEVFLFNSYAARPPGSGSGKLRCRACLNLLYH